MVMYSVLTVCRRGGLSWCGGWPGCGGAGSGTACAGGTGRGSRGWTLSTGSSRCTQCTHTHNLKLGTLSWAIKLDRIWVRSAILNCEFYKYKNNYFVAHPWTFSWLTLYCQHDSYCTFVKSEGKLNICCFSVDCGIIHSSTVCTSQYSLYTSLHCC